MAVDQSAVPKDLRPLNPNRPAIPNSSSDPLLASSAAAAAAHHSAVHFHSATVPNGNPHQPWPYAHHGAPNGVHDSAAALPPEDLSVSEDHQPSAGKKVKFLCSFGGKILPRVQDGALRYVGGHTRIIAIRKDASFAGLMQKMVEVQGGPVVLKYQLPDEDLDALVTVSCTEDLENMMEEYDKLSEVLQDGSAKLRVFLFSPAEFDPSLGFNSQMSEGQDSGQRYVDALNGIPESGSLRRKDSMASAASTQNSDGAAGMDFTVENAASEGMLPSSTASPAAQDVPKLAGLGGMPSLSAVPVSVQGGLVPPPHQNVAPMRPELSPPSLQAYVPQAYPDSHQETFNYMNMNIFPSASHYQYINPQQLGLGGAPVGYVAVPQNAYLPGMQITTAPPPPSAHVTTSRPMTSRAEHYLEENTYGGRAADPSNKPYQVPPQLPPLPPSNLQSMNLDRYGGAYAWPQAPLQPYTQQGHSTRLDESVLSQKPLPHAHSDPPVQDHRAGVISSTDLEKNPVFQSLQLEEAMHFHAQHKVVNPIVTDGVKDPKVETTMVASHNVQNDSERVAPQRSENFDNNRHIFPPGISGFPSDLRTIYNMHPSHHCQAPAGEALHYQQPSQMGMHQYPAMQDLFTNKVACVDTTSARSEIIHTYEPVSRDAGPLSFSHVKPIEGMLEGLCVNPESSGIYEMPKVVNKPDVSPPKSMVTGSTTLVTESRENTKLFEEKDLLSGSPLVTTGDPAEGISIKPVEHLPPSTLDVTYTNNIQPTGQVPPFMGNPGLYTHHVGSGGEPPIPNKRLLGVPNNKIPVVDRREQASSFPSTNVHNEASIPPCGNFPLSSSNTVRSKDNFGEIRNPVQRDSFLVDPDPWGVKQNAEILPSKPKRISSGESLVSKDASLENHVTYSGDAHPSAHLEKGNNQKPSDLNRDSFLDLMQPMKDVTDEKIKKEIPVVSDGMISPVIQPSVPTSTGISFLQANEYVPESGSSRIQDDNQELQNTLFSYDDCKPQDVKAKDKLNHGFHITEDIERLQIIKNNDLEELRELGSGTFGTVYHGKWRGTDVAIKRINDRCFAGKPSDQERMRQDFWNEACNLADLHHPNVVAFYGVVLDGPGGSIATVTEYMVNGSLRNALQKNDKALDMRKRLLIAMDVAFGMEYLHGKKIVHFDLKSDNLLVNLRDPQRPICKVGDLGLSKVKCQTLISGGVRGTLPWMAPELLNGCSSLVSEKVDVFSFGIVMWELLTGEEPYADLHYGAIIGGIVNNTLRPQVPDYCDPEWRSLMEICWSAEPSERPSFTEIAGRLRSLAASISQRGQSHSNPTASSQTQK